MTDAPGYAADEATFHAQLRDDIAESDIVPLLVALALRTGDRAYIGSDFTPDLAAYPLGPKPHGGLDAAQLARARELAFAGLSRPGVLGAPEHARPDDATLEAVLAFLTGEADTAYLPVIRRELGLNGDIESPAETGLLARASDGPAHTVAIIGAGISGLLMAIRLQQAGVAYTVLEKNDGIGGTWYENRYPGCRLDTSNFGYSYSFKQWNWQHYYSTRQEIEDYLGAAAREYGVLPHIRFRTEVEALTWEGGRWRVTRVEHGERVVEEYTHVITAVGQLNRPKIPEIPGQQEFTGEQWHSSQWPEHGDVRGLRVAVIGTGASAYQIVPAVAEVASELTVFQRSAPWILPTPGYSLPLPLGFRRLLDQFPEYGRVLRFTQFWSGLEGRRRFVVVDPEWTEPGSVSAINEEFREALSGAIRELFARTPELVDKLIPAYPPGSKRILRDDGGWGRALQQPHVHLVTEGIERVTERGVRTVDGTEHEVDVIVYATGFTVDRFLSPMRIRGVDGVDLSDVWRDDATALLGMHIAGFPNLMMLYGPNTNLVVNGSVVFLTECAVNRILEILDHQQRGGYRAVDVTPETVEAFTERLDAGNRAMAWGDDRAQTWYKGRSGRVISIWPFSMLDYWRATHDVDFDELQFS